MTRLTLRPAAAADAHDAYEWYENQRAGLGREFLNEVSAALERIGENPELYPIVFRDTRRALVRRFPYCVYYCRLDDSVLVVAVFHAKRDPKHWKHRK